VDRRSKVQLFEQIRREYEHGGGTIRGIAKKLGIHRRMVREAVLSAVPVERKTPVRERPKLEPAKAFVEAILEADRKAPRKQRHTAHRIWCRIQAEMPGVQIGESTIRHYVRERKMELRLVSQEVFVPQSYSWGKEAQVDWYEAYADIGGERQKAYVFCMRSMASGGAFHCAFPHASQQAFLEAHERAFAYFDGVFKILRYDNLRSAVKKILRGHQREETTRFIAFRSHWDFESEFCTPAKGHEKGGVEGEGGYFRRNHMVPVPNVASWEELDALLLESSKEDEQRKIGERTQTVGAGMSLEQEHQGAQGRLRSGRGSLPPCEHQWLREGTNQLLFRSAARRSGSAGQGAFRLRGDLASGRETGFQALFESSPSSLLEPVAHGPPAVVGKRNSGSGLQVHVEVCGRCGHCVAPSGWDSTAHRNGKDRHSGFAGSHLPGQHPLQ
jgi:transposase